MGPVLPIIVRGCPAKRWYNTPQMAPPIKLSNAAWLAAEEVRILHYYIKSNHQTHKHGYKLNRLIIAAGNC